ncbi:hypothetical protein AAMO2058_000186500 [Amorphochlora amoebiformis]
MRDIIVLIGPPGAGKGTVAPIIIQKTGVPQLSTGQMLRAAVKAGTTIGKQAQGLMAKGKLVPDEIVARLVKERTEQRDCSRGFILDGFPRTINQAKLLAKILEENNEYVTLAIEIRVPDSVLETRICGRWMHKASGRSYHVTFSPPKSMKLLSNGKPDVKTMKDDKTGEMLYQRKDDTPEALKTRLGVYHKNTAAILKFYNEILKVLDGDQSIKNVQKEAAVLMDDHMTSTFILRNPYNLVDAPKRRSKL